MRKKILLTGSAKHFGINGAGIECNSFGGGEISLTIKEPKNDLEGTEVFLIGSTNAPAENILEMLFAINALRRMGVSGISAVIPYFAYSRADKEKFPGESVSAEAVAKMLEAVGGSVLKVFSVDIHSERLRSFFNISFENIDASELFMGKFLGMPDLTVVGPDHGAKERAENFAKEINASGFATIDKERLEDGTVIVKGITGKVGKRVLMVDDIIDSAGTIIVGADFLKASGVDEIYVAATHTVWNSGGYLRLANSGLIKKVYTTNTIKPPSDVPGSFEVISVKPLLDKIINR